MYRVIIFNDNRLNGTIPTQIGSMSSLVQIILFNNEMIGPLPSEIGNLPDVSRLILYENSFTGTIPVELGNSSSLNDVQLASNLLNGPIPTELGQLGDVIRTGLDFSSNELSGAIPSELGLLVNLRSLLLQSNELEGPIPDEIGDLASLSKSSVVGTPQIFLFYSSIMPEVNLTFLSDFSIVKRPFKFMTMPFKDPCPNQYVMALRRQLQSTLTAESPSSRVIAATFAVPRLVAVFQWPLS